MKTTIWTEEQILLEQYAERATLSMLSNINTVASEIAKSIYHIVKKRGSVQTLLEQLYETHAAYLEKRSLQVCALLLQSSGFNKVADPSGYRGV